MSDSIAERQQRRRAFEPSPRDWSETRRAVIESGMVEESARQRIAREGQPRFEVWTNGRDLFAEPPERAVETPARQRFDAFGWLHRLLYGEKIDYSDDRLP